MRQWSRIHWGDYQGSKCTHLKISMLPSDSTLQAQTTGSSCLCLLHVLCRVLQTVAGEAQRVPGREQLAGDVGQGAEGKKTPARWSLTYVQAARAYCRPCHSSSPALQAAVLMLSTPCHPACAPLPLQVERDGLQKKLAAVAKQHSDASSRAATAQHQVDAVGKDQKRLAAEVERLSSVVHSHSVRLQK